MILSLAIQLEAEFKSPPRRAIEKFGMIGGRHDDAVRRQVVQLKEQRRHHSLDLASLVNVATFLGDRIELLLGGHALKLRSAQPQRCDRFLHLLAQRAGLAEFALHLADAIFQIFDRAARLVSGVP